MFEPSSRYFDVETATIEVPAPTGSRTVVYTRRRFIPAASQFPDVVEHTLGQGERLDLVSAAYFGDPTLFWRICDATGALRPSDLEQPTFEGRPHVVRVPVS